MIKLTRRGTLALASAIVAAPLLLSAGSGDAAAQSVLRVIPHADLQNIDPIWTTAYITRNHAYMVYDTLFALDENLEVQPQMVESWEVSDDNLTWTFTLRDGLLWHDGEPVTAEDCIASLERWGARDGMGQQLMGVIDSFEAVDEKTFTMQLSEPYGLVLESIGKISSNVPFMMPKRLAETDPFEQVPEVIGSGPFKFNPDEWVPGSKVVYEKFEDYVPRDEPPSGAAGGKIAKVDRVEWLYIPDPSTAMNALISGEVDYYEQPPADLVPVLESSEGMVVEVLDPLGNQGMMRMNHLHPPFDNQQVRQAALKAMDQERYMQAAVGNPEFYQVCMSYYACGAPLETDAGVEGMTYDPEAARALLEEAGYDGTPVVILQPADIPVTNAASLVTAESLRDIGMNVELVAMDWASITSRRAVKDPPEEGGWNIFHTWWIGGDISNPVVHTGIGAGGDAAWFGWPEDEEIEDLRRSFARETDPEKQRELADAVQARAIEYGTHGNFGTWFNPVAYRDYVSGLIESPVQFFWNVSVER
ncbi:ABC transporter substrate-binding protein [Aquibaculum sediminis]|uniref:ABC transporter substrate-binding protein n=1 Tax=Aquibaculum sediminis TaxID=3231907 RepID=UPI0034534198